MNYPRLLLAALLILEGCGTSTPASPPSPSASVASGPSSYTSAIYGYLVTLPPGWQSRPATTRWDGSGAPGHEDPTVDVLEPKTGLMSTFAFAAPTSLDLASYARDVIARNAQFHGDTCPPTPEKAEPTSVGGQPATFIAWNCGILINIAVAIRSGVGYQFAMRDPGVQAATDPTDRKAFDDLMKTVTFPS